MSVEELRAAEQLAKESSNAGWYAFGIVMEAKIAALIQMIRAKKPQTTKAEFLGMCETMWNKYGGGKK